MALATTNQNKNTKPMERRSIGPSELRVESDGKIRGYPVVFDQKSVDMGYREIVRPGAFSKTLKEKQDIMAMWNHDTNQVLGNTVNSTLVLHEDAHGLYAEIDPPDTQWARDRSAQIKRGDVPKASFGFRVVKDNWRDGGEVRELIEVELFEVSVGVTFPAYDQTDIYFRNAEDKTEGLKRFEVRADESENKVLDIQILDDIMDDFWGFGTSAKTIQGALNQAGPVNKINVKINSPGGDVSEAVAIFNLLKDHSANVHIKVIGLAASAASIITMAGDTITMGEGSFLMIHNAWTIAVGEESDMRSAAEMLKKTNQTLAEIYARRSSLTEAKAKELMNATTWITASEAVDMGLADRSAVLPDEKRSFSRLNYEFKNVPEDLKDRFEKRNLNHFEEPVENDHSDEPVEDSSTDDLSRQVEDEPKEIQEPVAIHSKKDFGIRRRAIETRVGLRNAFRDHQMLIGDSKN